MKTLTRSVTPAEDAPAADDRLRHRAAVADVAPLTGGISRAAAFHFAWAAYLFLHHTMVYYAWFRLPDRLGWREWAPLVVGFTFWLIGAVTLLRRASLGWFTALLVGHLAYELPALPKTANHTFLTICMNATMLAAIAAAAVRSR